MLSRSWFVIVAAFAAIGNAHTEITYPGWRGNNLGITVEFPFGMQWAYPCGGLPPTTNRTTWPVNNGAIAIQPGWFTGHSTAYFYINLGLGTDGPGGGPPNMSFPLVPIFEIIGPSDNPYPGMFCLPQISVPESLGVKVGDLATIQVVELSKSGAGLYNCVDIIFALEENVNEVNATNCFNSTTISFKDPFSNAATTTATTNPSETGLFSCPPCSTSASACPTQTSCPKANEVGSKDVGMGVGFPLGVLALGMLGL